MTTREFYITGMMLKAYRHICKISIEEFVKKSHISRSTLTRTERFINSSPTNFEDISFSLSFFTLKKIAIGMDMFYGEFKMMVETLSKEKDELLDVAIYIEIAKMLLKKKSMTMGE